ncbi:MAG: hypothetical protein AAGF95_18900 [Chloroflexota bacterium]
MKRQGHTQRKGRIYRFTVNGTDYAAFIWQVGARFQGRIENHPDTPEQTASTALAVRDALSNWINNHSD